MMESLSITRCNRCNVCNKTASKGAHPLHVSTIDVQRVQRTATEGPRNVAPVARTCFQVQQRGAFTDGAVAPVAPVAPDNIGGTHAF
jgi:hypothetical protein